MMWEKKFFSHISFLEMQIDKSFSDIGLEIFVKFDF